MTMEMADMNPHLAVAANMINQLPSLLAARAPANPFDGWPGRSGPFVLLRVAQWPFRHPER